MDLLPPRPLRAAAKKIWKRNAERIHSEGRWSMVDHELLAVWSETLALYLQFTVDVEKFGTLVQGRSQQEQVRNPSLMGLAQARADLVRLSKAVPLVDPNTGDADEFAETERLLESLK